MKRTAKANWTGDMTTGHGDLTTESTVLNHTQFSYSSRFAQGIGSNPEELLAAAHAGCFTMTIVYALSQKGLKASELETTAVVNVDLSKGGITSIDLSLDAAQIDGISEEEFLELAQAGKKNCLLSRALTGVEINLSVNYRILEAHA